MNHGLEREREENTKNPLISSARESGCGGGGGEGGGGGWWVVEVMAVTYLYV